MKSKDILTLLKRAQSGDESAISELLLMFEPLIKKCSYNALPADKDNPDRKDIEQELYIETLKAIQSFKIIDDK